MSGQKSSRLIVAIENGRCRHICIFHGYISISSCRGSRFVILLDGTAGGGYLKPSAFARRMGQRLRYLRRVGGTIAPQKAHQLGFGQWFHGLGPLVVD